MPHPDRRQAIILVPQQALLPGPVGERIVQRRLGDVIRVATQRLPGDDDEHAEHVSTLESGLLKGYFRLLTSDC